MSQYSKLEKADILEMTVKHLRQLQRHHVTQALTEEPTVVNKYRAGFNECANEVVRYLSSLNGVDHEVRERLVSHLGNVVTSLNHPSRDSQQHSQPLNIQIPHHVGQGVQSVPSGCLLMSSGVQSPTVILNANMPNAYSLGHTQVACTSPTQHDGHTTSQMCGTFQLVPSSTSGSVALYLGHSDTVAQPTDSVTQAVPLYTCSSNTPPRTKASFKAYDKSAFSDFNGEQNIDDAKSVTPVSQKCLSDQMEFQLRNVVGYGRTPSPLKMEDVWRPW